MATPEQIKAAWGAMSPEEQDGFIKSLSDTEASKLADSLNQPSQAQQPQTVRGQVEAMFPTDNRSFSQALSDAGTTIANIPGSAVNFAGNMANAILHPIETVKGIGSLVTNPDARAAVGQFYSNRYGSPEKFRQTSMNDPVGVLSDTSAVLGLGAGALRLAGAKTAADAAMKASNAINPINIAAKAVSPVVKNIYSYAVGQTTGSGKRAVDEALKGSQDFVDAMRGNLTDEQVLQNSRDAIQSLKDSRSAAYQGELSNLKNATQSIPINDVKALADSWLKRYGVQNIGGKLDFSRSTLKDVAANEVQSIYDDIASWGSKAQDTTPLGLDTLKRRIQNNFVQNSQSRAMATSLSNAVRNKIVENVPSYAKMTSDYEKSSGVINSIEYALSTKNPAAADTALRKIMTAMRQDVGFRRAMLDTLDQQAGGNITGQAAGRVMSNPWSSRLGPMLTTTGAGMAALLHNPMMVALLPLASPRVMGEFSRAAGAAARMAGKIPKIAPLAAERQQAISENQ